MTVSELAKRAGVTAETVRHYTRSGLLTPQRQKQNGYYYYGDSDLVRLLFIHKARLLGFGLDDVTEILHMSGYGRSPCPRVREILEGRLQDNRCRLKELESLQTRMEQAAKMWSEMPDGMPDGDSVCHLIESIGYPELILSPMESELLHGSHRA